MDQERLSPQPNDDATRELWEELHRRTRSLRDKRIEDVVDEERRKEIIEEAELLRDAAIAFIKLHEQYGEQLPPQMTIHKLITFIKDRVGALNGQLSKLEKEGG